MDDVLVMHDPNLDINQIISDIYPNELNIVRTNDEPKMGSFLDLKIYLNNNKFETGLYNKVNDFHFHVSRLQKYDSNISFNVKHACVIGEIIRISRCCSNKTEFTKAIKLLLNVSFGNGFKAHTLHGILNRTIRRKQHIIFKFKLPYNKKGLSNWIQNSF